MVQDHGLNKKYNMTWVFFVLFALKVMKQRCRDQLLWAGSFPQWTQHPRFQPACQHHRKLFNPLSHTIDPQMAQTLKQMTNSKRVLTSVFKKEGLHQPCRLIMLGLPRRKHCIVCRHKNVSTVFAIPFPRINPQTKQRRRAECTCSTTTSEQLI